MTVSWLEALEQREAAVTERIERLRGQVAELSVRLGAAGEQLSRLRVTRETMLEILAAPGGAGDPDAAVTDGGAETAGPVLVSAGGSPIGVVLVSPLAEAAGRESVLPVGYRDILEVLSDSGKGVAGRAYRRGAGPGGESGEGGRVAVEVEAADRARLAG